MKNKIVIFAILVLFVTSSGFSIYMSYKEYSHDELILMLKKEVLRANHRSSNNMNEIYDKCLDASKSNQEFIVKCDDEVAKYVPEQYDE